MSIKHLKNVLIPIFIILISTSLIFLTYKIVFAPESFFNSIKKDTNNNYQLPEVPEEKETIISFGGDVMLSRTVNAKMEDYNDYFWPFKEIANYFKNVDFSIINLESPFIKNSNYQVLTGSFSFKANPKSIQSLTNSGIDMVSLANNHIINQGKQGIIDTMEILNDNNILFSGAGLNDKQARNPVIKDINGNKFAFLSYAYPNDYSVATQNTHGLANMDEKKLQEDIEMLTNNNSLDYIIIIMHAGIEYTHSPNWQQKEFAQLAIDLGADMVVGHHPHWPQEFEIYNEKPIIYSLGNLVFDQMWSEKTRQGLILESTWQNGLKRLELIPTKIYDYGQVKILDKNIEEQNREREKILNDINAPINGIIYEK